MAASWVCSRELGRGRRELGWQMGPGCRETSHRDLVGAAWGAGLRDLPDSPNSCAQSHAEKEEKMEPPAPSRAASPTCPPAADGPVSPRATEMRLGQVLWSHP
ncbi:unnamed protein product [Lepidochelys kempii]